MSTAFMRVEPSSMLRYVSLQAKLFLLCFISLIFRSYCSNILKHTLSKVGCYVFSFNILSLNHLDRLSVHRERDNNHKYNALYELLDSTVKPKHNQTIVKHTVDKRSYDDA